MENQILETLRMLDQDKITNKDFMWEYLKCKIRKFTVNFSKDLVTRENKYQNVLERELKKLEKILTNFKNKLVLSHM